MPPTRRPAPRLSDAQLGEHARARQGGRQRRAEAHRPDRLAPGDHPGPADRPGRGPAAPGLLLRHAGPRPRQGRARRPRAAHPGRPRRHGRQAAPGRPDELPDDGPPLGELQRRGRRDARRLRLLGLDEGPEHRGGDPRRGAAGPSRCGRSSRRSSARSSRSMRRRESRFDQLVPLGPTFILKLVWSSRRSCNRKFVAELWLYQDGSRILELSTKCLPGEAFQVAAEARAYLVEHGRRPRRRAADEDADRARVLPGGARGGRRSRGAVPGGRAGARRAAARPPEPGRPGRPAGGRPARRRRPRPRRRRPRPAGTTARRGDSGSDRDGSPTGDDRRHEDDARRLDDPACGDAAEGVDLEGIDCEADDPEGAGREDRRDHAPDAPPERLIGLRTRTRREPAGLPVGSLDSRQIARALVERQSLERRRRLDVRQLTIRNETTSPTSAASSGTSSATWSAIGRASVLIRMISCLDLRRLARQLRGQCGVAHQLGVVVQGRRDLLLVRPAGGRCWRSSGS